MTDEEAKRIHELASRLAEIHDIDANEAIVQAMIIIREMETHDAEALAR